MRCRVPHGPRAVGRRDLDGLPGNARREGQSDAQSVRARRGAGECVLPAVEQPRSAGELPRAVLGRISQAELADTTSSLVPPEWLPRPWRTVGRLGDGPDEYVSVRLGTSQVRLVGVELIVVQGPQNRFTYASESRA